jgi:hypothetical protein
MRSGGAGDRDQPDNKGVGQTKRAEVQKEGGGQFEAGMIDAKQQEEAAGEEGQGREVGRERGRRRASERAKGETETRAKEGA